MEDSTRDSNYWRTNQTRETVDNSPSVADRDYQDDYAHDTILWTIEPGQLSTGKAWYHHATVNGHRLSIVERPAIGYCRWYGSTQTEVIEDQPAASLDAAKSAAESWAWEY